MAKVYITSIGNLYDCNYKISYSSIRRKYKLKTIRSNPKRKGRIYNDKRKRY